jgi:hypothetical protein
VTKEIKKLSTAELKKQNKALNEKRDFSVMIGEEEYKLTHDVKFRRTKQHQLLDDMIAFFNEGANRIELYELATPYTALLILKHFTSLEVSDEIDEAVDLLQVLIDLEILDKILNELPEDEVVKVYELITQTVDVMKENYDAMEEEASSIVEQIENEQVKELFLDGNK